MRNIDITKYFLPTFQPLVFDNHFQLLLFGGRGGGKSVNGAARKLIFRMQSDGRINCLVLRKNEKDHRDSTYAELKKAINAYADLIYETALTEETANGNPKAKEIALKEKQDYLGLWKYNESKLKITYLPCGNKIIFKGFNDPVSIKSTQVEEGLICFVWLEEGEAIESKADFDEAMDSFRGERPDDLPLQIIVTFNAPFNNHWLKDEADNAGMKVNFPKNKYMNEYYPNYTYPSISLEKGTDKNTLAHYSCYTQNPKLSQLDRERYERTATSNPAYYKWRYLGEFGSKSGQVFTNWRVEDFNVQEIIKPINWRYKSDYRILGGLDFGFVHPTAFYMSAINKKDKKIYIFDGFSMQGLSNSEIVGQIVAMGYSKERIVCENAEPRTIKEMKKMGLHNLKPVHKYKGTENSSIIQGIKLMMEYDIVIHSKLKQMIRGFTNYVWDTDKYGDAIERPINVDDDEVTSVRYQIMAVEKDIYGFLDID